MVRIKHRYLLVNILYPDKPSEIAARSEAINRDAKPLPDIVQFHQPTPDEVTPQLLLRTVREHIALLYGDYGAGVTTSGLSGKHLPKVQYQVKILLSDFLFFTEIANAYVFSEVFLPSNVDVYPPCSTYPFSPCLGCSYDDDASAQAAQITAIKGVRNEGCSSQWNHQEI